MIFPLVTSSLERAPCTEVAQDFAGQTIFFSNRHLRCQVTWVTCVTWDFRRRNSWIWHCPKNLPKKINQHPTNSTSFPRNSTRIHHLVLRYPGDIQVISQQNHNKFSPSPRAMAKVTQEEPCGG